MQTLFNQPAPSRHAKPWQPNARLVPDDTGRGFASTRWLQPEGAGFAEGGFEPRSAGFAQDRYQTVSMPLSEKSKTTLRLMGETEGSESFSIDDVQRLEPESPNAHLPFVLDVYGVKPKVHQALATTADDSTADASHVSATDAIDADVQAGAHDENAHAEEVEADQVEHATAEEPETQEALQAADDEQSSDMTEDAVGPSEDDAQAQAVEIDPELVHVQPEEQPDPTVEPQPEPDLAESELLTDENAGEPQALGAEVDELLAQAPVPAVTVVGIDPEEVAQREAAQFAQGLAQGIEQGERQAREAMQQEVAAQCAVLSAVTHDLNALLQDPKKFFEPLKRLALHVAEHVVMKELSTSTEAIERLVQRCLDELDHPAKGAVVVELSPQDKERLQAQDSALVAGMRLDAVKGMKPGSVRLFANDTVVEDLVEHRLEALARSLSVDVEDWRAKSVLAQPEAEVSEPEVEDVEPNDVHS